MKPIMFAVLALAVLCVAPCAHAEQHGTTYATVKAIVDYCGRVDEEHKSDYAAFGAKVLASITGTEGSANYDAVYLAVTDELRSVPREQGRTQCQAGIGYRGGSHDRDDR